MKYETTSKLFNWLLQKWPIALFVILVLLLIALTSCTTTKKLTTQSDYQHQQTLTQSDSQTTIDRTVIYDTVHQIILETLWRAPDTLGKIYPRVTTRTEYGAQRQTQNDIVTQTHDTIYVHEATKTSEQNETDIRAPTTTTQVLPWLIILGLIALCVLVIAIRVLIKV